MIWTSNVRGLKEIGKLEILKCETERLKVDIKE